MGGAAHKAAHNVFVWDRESGVLVKVLEGPRDSLGDCHVCFLFGLWNMEQVR
jgi:COMPASS component SWD1